MYPLPLFTSFKLLWLSNQENLFVLRAEKGIFSRERENSSKLLGKQSKYLISNIRLSRTNNFSTSVSFIRNALPLCSPEGCFIDGVKLYQTFVKTLAICIKGNIKYGENKSASPFQPKQQHRWHRASSRTLNISHKSERKYIAPNQIVMCCLHRVTFNVNLTPLNYHSAVSPPNKKERELSQIVFQQTS